MELDELFGIVEKALEGESSAQYRLGDCFYNGIGVNVDYQKAAFWFEKAAEQENVDSQYMLGLCYYLGNGFGKDFEKARLWFKKAADRGDELSQVKLALIYENGEGVEQDYEESAYWYKKAGENGSDLLSRVAYFSAFANGLGGVFEEDVKQSLFLATKAIEAISSKREYIKLNSSLFKYFGGVYEHGISVKKDYEKAVYWYTKAAEAGNVNAQLSLSDIYFEGRGLKKNLEKAEYWTLKAQELGGGVQTDRLYKIHNSIRYGHADDNISWVVNCAERGIVDAQSRLGYYYSGEKSVYWFEKAAEQGDCDAQSQLGQYYRNIDTEKSIFWLTKAAEQGDRDAPYLIWFIYKGTGEVKNLEEGVRWLTKAAENGIDHAQTELVDCYLDGVGVEKDYKKAAYWLINGDIWLSTFDIDKLKIIINNLTIARNNLKLFEAGGNQGLIEAQLSLASYYSRIDEQPKDAFYWYKKAAEQGHMDAQYEVGRCFILGVGTAKDIEEGKKWLNKAADQGHKEAQRELKEMNKTEETVGETKTQTSPQNNEISTNNTIATENKHITIPDVVPLPEDIRRYIDAEISENFRSKSAKWHYYVQSDEDLFFWKRLVQFTQRVKDVYERKGFYVTIDSYKYGIDFKFLIKTD